MLAFTSTTMADALPGELRNSIAEHTVAIRVLDRSADQLLQSGAGLIVAESNGQIVILTAQHVLHASGFTTDEMLIEVRPSWNRQWSAIDAITYESDPKADLAAIRIGRTKLRPDNRTFSNRLAQSPSTVATPKAPIWALGYHADSDTFQWVEGVIRFLDGDLVGFDAVGVKPGFSGGVLAASLGPIGLIQTAGSRSQKHRAYTLDAAAIALRRSGVEMQLRQNPVLIGLTNALDNERLLTLFLSQSMDQREFVTWAAIRLTQRDGRIFRGDIMTTIGGAECEIEWTPGGISFRTSINAWGYGLFATLPHLNEFVPDADALPHHATLMCETGNLRGHLAIPLANCETLPARALACGADKMWRATEVSDVMRGMFEYGLQRSQFKVMGRLIPYVMRGFPVDLGYGRVGGVKIEIWLPRQHNLDRVEISGSVIMTDAYRKLDEEKLKLYEDAAIVINRIPAQSNPSRFSDLLQTNEATPFQETITNAPAGILFEFTGQGHVSSPPLVRGPILVYVLKE